MELRYKRISLKLSGEALAGAENMIDFCALESMAEQIGKLSAAGVEVGVTIGGGNIWRGRDSGEFDRNKADQMGMLATVINALALADALKRAGTDYVVLSSIAIPAVCDQFRADKADEALSAGKVVIFAGGSGLPFFSTDTAAAMRAAETGADALLLAKNVDTIYTADPKTVPDARPLPRLTYDEAIALNLKALDAASIVLCRDNAIPIRFFAASDAGNILKICAGEDIGTTIN